MISALFFQSDTEMLHCSKYYAFFSAAAIGIGRYRGKLSVLENSLYVASKTGRGFCALIHNEKQLRSDFCNARTSLQRFVKFARQRRLTTSQASECPVLTEFRAEVRLFLHQNGLRREPVRRLRGSPRLHSCGQHR